MQAPNLACTIDVCWWNCPISSILPQILLWKTLKYHEFWKKIYKNMWKSITLYYTNKLKRHFAKTVQHKTCTIKSFIHTRVNFSKKYISAQLYAKTKFSNAISEYVILSWPKIYLKRSENVTSSTASNIKMDGKAQKISLAYSRL